MKFIDLFAGIGGFRKGLGQVGFNCVGYVEKDKFARKSYQAMYNTEGEWTRDDIREVRNEEWKGLRGEVEIITGGFPCQSFSIAGRRGGFQDTRGTLFFEIARAIEQIEPRFFILENVKGLLSHDKGETFTTIVNTLDEIGYNVEWGVFNSKHYGSAQNRERVYIIGHNRGRSGREVLFNGGAIGEVERRGVKTDKEIEVVGNISKTGYQSHNVLGVEGISTTLLARDFKGAKTVMIPREEDQTYNIEKEGKKYLARRLTPIEYWRLQGFSDEDFYKAQSVNSNSQLYKQAGNSVTVGVVRVIAQVLKELYKEEG